MIQHCCHWNKLHRRMLMNCAMADCSVRRPRRRCSPAHTHRHLLMAVTRWSQLSNLFHTPLAQTKTSTIQFHLTWSILHQPLHSMCLKPYFSITIPTGCKVRLCHLNSQNMHWTTTLTVTRNIQKCFKTTKNIAQKNNVFTSVITVYNLQDIQTDRQTYRRM